MKRIFNSQLKMAVLGMFILCALLILAPPITTAEAAFSGGDGSQNAPYIIRTQDDLELLAQLVNNNISDSINPPGLYAEKSYILENDITLTDLWTPIGRYNISVAPYPFSGKFNGKDRKSVV